MKKLKIIKCLAPLLGLSITLGTITPIIASCSDNSTSNDSNNGSNDNKYSLFSGLPFNAEIKQLKTLIDDISKIDFTKIANDFKDKYQYAVSESYLFGLELSREDLCNELAD